jgi:excisionase family DNA binding protein
MQAVTITQVNLHELEAIIEGAIKRGLESRFKENDSPPADDLLTVPEVADLLRLSIPTIYSLIHKRELTCMKRGKRVYFKRSWIMEYLEHGKKRTLSELQSESEVNHATKNKGGKL